MRRILFICHGNICRSVMAQFVLQDMVNRKGLASEVYIDSAAATAEELGNGPHRGVRVKLAQVGVPMFAHRARQITRADYEKFDLIFGMDEENMSDIRRIFGGDPKGKCRLLLEGRSIADPWYTGNFDDTYRDVLEGCTALLNVLTERNMG